MRSREQYTNLGKSIAGIAKDTRWASRVKVATDLFSIHDYSYYYDQLSELYHSVEMWETHYMHVLESHKPILGMIGSTGLKPCFECIPSFMCSFFYCPYGVLLTDAEFSFWKVFSISFIPVLVFSILVILNISLQVLHSFYCIVDIFRLFVLTVFSFITLAFISSRESACLKDVVVKYRLSPREAEVLALLLEGRTNNEMGEELFVSLSTIKAHISSVFQKTNAQNRLEVAALCKK